MAMNTRRAGPKIGTVLRGVVWGAIAALFDDTRGSYAVTRARIRLSLADLVTIGLVAVAILLAIGYHLFRLPIVGRYLERLAG
jgi:hypothetical protein